MVRSEEELRIFDFFKIAGLCVWGLSAFGAYMMDKRDKQSVEARWSFSVITPPDDYLEEDPAVFSGIAPGVKVLLVSRTKKLGEAKVENHTWTMKIPAEAVGDIDVKFRAMDERGDEVASTELKRYRLSDSIGHKTAPKVKKSPVKVNAPAGGQSLRPGPADVVGTGLPGTKIKIFANKLPLGIVTPDGEGKWKIATNFRPGDYRLSAVTPSDKSTVEFSVR
jgi:hypothetical protein